MSMYNFYKNIDSLFNARNTNIELLREVWQKNLKIVKNYAT
jgi:hypothetical protein